MLLLLLGLGGLALDYIGLPGFSCSTDGVIFEEGHGLSYEEGCRIYNQAGEALKENRPKEAFRLYGQIKDSYKRLRPLILIHQADACAQQGNESCTQEILQSVMKSDFDEPFHLLAEYQLGQSYIRSRQNSQAKAAFEAILQQAPESNLTLGSHYYLGEIAKGESDAEKAASHWRSYLRGSIDGTFSLASAKGLKGLSMVKTVGDYRLIGLALFHQQQWKEAISYLSRGEFGPVWLELGLSSVRAGNTTLGTRNLERGLHMTGPSERAEEAIKALMSLYPSAEGKKAKLLQILKANPKTGGDFILWQLRQLSGGEEANRYGRQLLERYPKSNWAPETSWELMWPLFQSGRTTDFLQQAEKHMALYPTSISAPRVMYWQAKAQLKQDKGADARKTLQSLDERYPYQYYAFRARQVLGNDPNPWRTQPSISYPKASKDIEPGALARYVQNEKLIPSVAELVRIGNADDLLLLAQLEPKGKLSEPLMSFVYRQQKSYNQSIRIIRDFLDGHRKAGRPLQDDNLYRLLYPLVYSDDIKRYATINSLDPFLVQAVARQESYFNPFAVSRSNAMGLMQLLPSTAEGVAKWENLSGFQTTTLLNPSVNIRLGTRYLRYLHEKFGGNSLQAVGGYNGGPGAMERWSRAIPYVKTDPDLFIESIPYRESRNYIKEVFSHYWNYLSLYQNS